MFLRRITGSADLFAARWDAALPGSLAAGRRPAYGFNSVSYSAKVRSLLGANQSIVPNHDSRQTKLWTVGIRTGHIRSPGVSQTALGCAHHHAHDSGPWQLRSWSLRRP